MEQKEAHLELSEKISPEVFINIVKTNIAGVLFDPREGQAGNIIRLNDEILDNFNTFDPSTWKNKRVAVKRYQVILNPDLDEETTLLGFLRQVNNVRIDLGNGNNISTSSEINQSSEKGKMKHEENIQKFYVQNQELIKFFFVVANLNESKTGEG